MRTRRTPPPAARKLTLAEQATDPFVEAPRAVLERLRSLVDDADDESPADGFLVPCEPSAAPGAAAISAPLPGDGVPMAVERAFAFIDICGFTSYCDQHGEQAAIEILTHFRSVTRQVVGRRGVRVAKWLGDGVMLVGTEMTPLLAAVAELECRFRATGLDTHAGVAGGSVLLFEGDDYVGRAVNLAARLSDAAQAGEILAAEPPHELPNWMEPLGQLTVQVAGMGRVAGVVRVRARPEVDAALAGDTPAA
ncbi:MAG: adenylate/guanylate cyclase domain-containing protein [Acidimicrobiia bacterium]|nr:adenylate/guanylate cyclase domain-containing protein [Acidimicrobiia bacterium]